MSKKPLLRHLGNAKDGVAYLDDVELYVENIKSLEGQRIQVTIEAYSEPKTQGQLGYFFGGILPTAMQDECFGGWTKQEIREHLESKFLQKTYMKTINGEEVCIFTTETVGDLNKEQLNEFIGDCLWYLAGLGIEVKDPSQYRLDKYRVNDKQ